MHILEVCSGHLINGAITHTLLLTRELVQRGHRVTVVCRPGSWIGQQLAHDQVELVWSDLQRWPPGELRRVAALVRERGVDVIHTHMSRAHFFGILLRWLTGVPSVATAQSRHFQLHWMFNDHVVAVSEAQRSYQTRRNFVRPSRITTIHNFIDYRRIVSVPPNARREAREELGIDAKTLLVGQIGDVFPRKGQIYLVEAMADVFRQIPETRLVVVGPHKDPRYVAQCMARAERLGIAPKIIWAGQRNDVQRLLPALDLKVLASLEESLPLAILEAMASRLPVVTTSAGGSAECIDEGRTGLVVPPADPPALARAIVELLQDAQKRRQFGEAGHRRVLERFSAESHTVALESLFARLLKRRRAA